jgi:hypothetical protein
MSASIFANSFDIDLVCKNVKKSDVEEMLGKKFKISRPVKLPINPSYDVSGCEYTNKLLAQFSIYYYGKGNSFESCIPPFYKVKEIKDAPFKAVLVMSEEDNKIFQIVGETKKGVLSFIFSDAIDDYKKAFEFMKKLREIFK